MLSGVSGKVLAEVHQAKEPQRFQLGRPEALGAGLVRRCFMEGGRGALPGGSVVAPARPRPSSGSPGPRATVGAAGSLRLKEQTGTLETGSLFLSSLRECNS